MNIQSILFFLYVITVKTAEKPSLSSILSEKGVYGGLFLMGEVMFIVRPLVYVLLIRKNGTQSWFPWFTSLAIDLIANGVLSYVTALRTIRKDPLFDLSNQERDEVSHINRLSIYLESISVAFMA